MTPDKLAVLDAVLEVVSRTRFYIGDKLSAPYARAAVDVLEKRGIEPPVELKWLIQRICQTKLR
jgi:hypothetical protein